MIPSSERQNPTHTLTMVFWSTPLPRMMTVSLRNTISSSSAAFRTSSAFLARSSAARCSLVSALRRFFSAAASAFFLSLIFLMAAQYACLVACRDHTHMQSSMINYHPECTNEGSYGACTVQVFDFGLIGDKFCAFFGC